MANYYCSSRSNYFRVKNATAFRHWAESLGIEVHEKLGTAGYFAVFPARDDDTGAFPNTNPTTEKEIDFAAELSAHLADGSIAVILEVGAEKLRYLHGHAVAVDFRGKRVQVFLDDIYELAARTFPGREIIPAEY
ncbi:MAG TPA: hypothetical protein VL200_00850 [Lacunisphaera sp.]|jgi:hypothetical protein|nr:hypothetical protein [Lacunisphaera sp.]